VRQRERDGTAPRFRVLNTLLDASVAFQQLVARRNGVEKTILPKYLTSWKRHRGFELRRTADALT